MTVTKEHIDEQYEKLILRIKKEFEADQERVTSLIAMYDELKELVKFAPASSKVHYHNAYEGGYLDHIHNVIDRCIQQATIYAKGGGKIDFTRAELIFSAMHHDLGKIGDLDGPLYVPQDSDWHRKTLGQTYKYNSDIQYLTVHDRTMWLLQQYGIKVTKNEMLGIKLADGLYDEGNGAYFKNNDAFPMHSILPYLIHWGDHMACMTEKFALFYATKEN